MTGTEQATFLCGEGDQVDVTPKAASSSNECFGDLQERRSSRRIVICTIVRLARSGLQGAFIPKP